MLGLQSEKPLQGHKKEDEKEIRSWDYIGDE